MNHTIYSYQNDNTLLYTGQSLCNYSTNSAPVNQNLIKLHRGADNDLVFKVINRDRKLQDVRHLEVKLVLIDTSSREIVIEKYNIPSDERGIIRFQVYEGDLRNISSGQYTAFIIGEESLSSAALTYKTNNLFYTNQSHDVAFQIEVTDQIFSTAVKTNVILSDDWLPLSELIDGVNRVSHFSSPLSANRIKNHNNPMHTIAMFFENYSGIIEIYGTIEEIPQQTSQSWFKINPTTLTDKIECNLLSDVITLTFSANINWIKIKKIDDLDNTGVVKKIHVRS